PPPSAPAPAPAPNTTPTPAPAPAPSATPTPASTPTPAPTSQPAPASTPTPAAADGGSAPPGPPAPDHETVTGGAGGNTGADGEAEAEAVRHLTGLTGVTPVTDALAARLGTLVKLGRGTAGLADVVLEGPPGSGRRAVAAAYGRALAELGIVASGALTHVPLSAVPARWPTQPHTYLTDVFRRAAGGLLTVAADPAFWSRPETERRPVLDALTARAAARGPRGAVLVLCGGAHRLMELLRTRTDLAGTFAEYLRLPAWTGAGLAELTRRRLTAHGFEVSDDVLAALAAQDPSYGAYGAHRLADRIAARAGAPTLALADLIGELPAAEALVAG
ncbi:hypothetical protein MB828_02180, partial [Streptomyces arenae]|nr:hypothetical protein [Streptomyces arenae]